MSRRVILTLQFKPPFEPKPDTKLKFTVSTTGKAFEDTIHLVAQLGWTHVAAGERIFLLDDGAQISTDTVFGAIALFNKGEEKTLPFESVTYAEDDSRATVSLQISYVQDAKRPSKATSPADAVECIAASLGLACQEHDTGNVRVYAGADKDEESSDDDTQLSPVSTGKNISKKSSKTPKTSTKKQKRGANTPWLATMKASIPDFIPLEDDQYVQVACEARPYRFLTPARSLSSGCGLIS